MVLRAYGHKVRSYCGIDCDSSVIESLSLEFPEHRFLTRDLETDTLSADAQFDCIVMLAFVEHIFNQKFLMTEVARALRSGGRVVLTTPMPFGNDIVHR